MNFLPVWPVELNTLFFFGFLLFCGALGGFLAHRVSWLPSITGFMLVGLIAGPNVLGIFDAESLAQARIVVDIALALILYAESYGSIRSFALRHGDRVSANRDLLALGAANLASGLFQGMPVGAGYSASSANEASGAESRAARRPAAVQQQRNPLLPPKRASGRSRKNVL